MKTAPFFALVSLALAPPASAQLVITGAGSTFSNILYQDWIRTYNEAHPEVELVYESIGSGAGVRQFFDRAVDFGASDAPITDSAMTAMGGDAVHIPTEMGAVVAAYTLPGVTAVVRFTPGVLADVFLGKLTRWNDPRIVALNPGVPLPPLDIIVVHRSDGSGTTYILSDYLSKVSPEWRAKVGKGTIVAWPTGLGAKGSEGVAGVLKVTPGGIGYVELGYVASSGLVAAAVQNRAGAFIAPTLESITAAAAGAMRDMGPNTDFRVSITDADGPDAYPISSFTWMLLRGKNENAAKAAALAQFVWWTETEGQARCAPLGYAPLPAQLRPWIQARLRSVTGGR
ncbi:MAG TPA: phosphate ABC transporter substrate-binding protein PstS [Gemmatimonadales bacterium]|nr:phosphate ABC transporter substrate-binding protein PstS [Gemmatimonadales bacterium]